MVVHPLVELDCRFTEKVKLPATVANCNVDDDDELEMPSNTTDQLVDGMRPVSLNVVVIKGKAPFSPLLLNVDVANDSLIEPVVVKFCSRMPLFSVYVMDTGPPIGLWKLLWGNE